MSCAGCSTKNISGEKVSGCGTNNGCATGGCNRLNTFDWLSKVPLSFNNSQDLYEISFNQGSRKEFYRSVEGEIYEKGDVVSVETKNGFDIGKISLRGELVKLQMKKKRFKEKFDDLRRIYRLANEGEIESYTAAKAREFETMVKSRIIARDLKLDMKIGQVEYQADGKKATFYYIAEGRVDFRELIKRYASEFKIKIEMRQIGARQAGKIGGMGPCGRELCCSTWLTNFKSVSTSAVRYQNLSINQSKLSGQCGRLKCCLNYELDAYVDAVKYFPKKAPFLKTEAGNAKYIKNDIFKGILYYQYLDKNKIVPLTIARVKEIEELNKKGDPVASLEFNTAEEIIGFSEPTFEDGSGVLTLETIEQTSKRIKNREKRKRYNDRKRQNSSGKNRSKNQGKQQGNQQNSNKPKSNQNRNTGNKSYSKNKSDSSKNPNTDNKTNSNSNTGAKKKPFRYYKKKKK